MAATETVLRNLIGELAKERGYKEYDVEIQPASSGGANYTSAIFLITLTPFQQAPLKLFAKVGKGSDAIRQQTGGRLYEIEKFFYTEFKFELEKIQDDHCVSDGHRFTVSKFYTCSDSDGVETFVLEDLTARGFKSFDRMKSFNWEYAASSVEQLARMHALSFALQLENPEYFETIKQRYPIPLEMMETMAPIFMTTIQSSMMVVRDDLKGKLNDYLDKTDIIQEMIAAYMPGEQEVLLHGDYRASNLMHRRKNGKLEIVPVDFQVLYLGNPMADLTYFIFTGSDQEFRRLYYKSLINFYYEELGKMLERLHLDVNEIYPRKDFEQDLSRQKMMGLFIALTTLSIVCVDTKSAPELGSEMTAFNVKPSEVYVERLNEVVDDFVKWGHL